MWQTQPQPFAHHLTRRRRAEELTPAAYCSHCYASGRFTRPDITAAEMQELVKGKLVQFGIPRFFTGLFTRGIPKLERWKKAA